MTSNHLAGQLELRDDDFDDFENQHPEKKITILPSPNHLILFCLKSKWASIFISECHAIFLLFDVAATNRPMSLEGNGKRKTHAVAQNC